MPHLITIVTPCFNSARFLPQCLEQVYLQRHSEVEYLVMDGKSTDASAQILQEWQVRWPQLRVVSQPDKGQSDAMNKAVTLATGEYVWFLNVDDKLLPGSVNYVVDRLKQLPQAEFLVGNCVVQAANGTQTISKPRSLTSEDILAREPWSDFPLNPVSYLYRRSLHQQVGLYDMAEHYAMDRDFLIRAFAVVKPTYIDKELGVFVQHDECKTMINKKKRQGRVFVPLDALSWRYYQKLPLGGRLRVGWRFIVGNIYRGLMALKVWLGGIKQSLRQSRAKK